MNLILLFEEDFVTESRVCLRDRRAVHVREVHRAKNGDQLVVGRLNGLCGLGTVVASSAEAIELDVLFDGPPPPPATVHLLLALPRPKSLKRVLHAATSMGVKEIVLFHSWRVEKSFWDSPVLKPDGILEPLLIGLEQGRDTMVPTVRAYRRFRPFVEDVLPGQLAGRRALVAHPRALSPCPYRVPEPVTLAVGPEGGFVDYELNAFRALGFEIVAMGVRPLRVEHAVPALLGRLL